MKRTVDQMVATPDLAQTMTETDVTEFLIVRNTYYEMEIFGGGMLDHVRVIAERTGETIANATFGNEPSVRVPFGPKHRLFLYWKPKDPCRVKIRSTWEQKK